MIHFLVPAAGAFAIEDYLRLDGPAVAARFRVTRYEALGATTRFERGTYVLAGLDQLTGPAAQVVAQLCDALRSAGGVRILNDPRRSLGRLALSDQLYARGLNSYRAVRATGDLSALRYPVFLRDDRLHAGSLSPLLYSQRDAEAAIGRALIQGHPLANLLAIEYRETVSADAIYRKYAAFRLGAFIQARSLNQGRHWMTKFETSEFTEPLAREELDYVTQNPYADRLAEIFDIAGIEYGQIDFAVKDGHIETWEINMNPTIGRGAGPDGGVGPPEVRPIRSAAREYFFDQFRAAWAVVDIDGRADAPVAITLAGAAQLDSRPHANGSRRAIEIVKTALRPFKPVIEPIAAPMLRLLALVGRRFS